MIPVKVKKKAPTVVLAVLLLVTIAFIWSNSLRSVSESAEESRLVTEAIRPILERIVGAGYVTDHLVRKLAHFTEFGALGCELALLIVVRKRRGLHLGLQPVLNGLFAGLTVAVLDETLQLFSKRGAQLQDVWLDFSGVATGLFITILIVKLFGQRKY